MTEPTPIIQREAGTSLPPIGEKKAPSESDDIMAQAARAFQLAASQAEQPKHVGGSVAQRLLKSLEATRARGSIAHLDFGPIKMEKPTLGVVQTEDPAGGVGQAVFGIGKDGISRALVKFQEPPRSMPYTIMFYFSGVMLTHRFVMAMIKGLLQPVKGAKITKVQFVDRNVMLGTRTLENRWLVTVNTQEAKKFLIANGLDVVNRKVPIRSYDDVQAEDYAEYLNYMEYQKYIGMAKEEKKEKAPDETEEGKDVEEKSKDAEPGQEAANADPNTTAEEKEKPKPKARTMQDADGNVETAVGASYDSDDSLANIS